MKKNIYITLLVIVTICCIIGGTAFHVLNWFSGFPDLWNWGNSSGLDSSRVTSSEVLDPFRDVTIDGSVLDITIETGAEYSLTYDCVAYLVPDVSVENGMLKIIQPSVPNFSIGIHNNHCEMTLTVPAGSALDDLHVFSDVGDITVSGLTVSSGSIQSDVGDLDIKKCTFDVSDLSTDVGDLNVYDCSLGAGTATSDVGSISLDLCTFTSLDASSDVGDISIRAADDLSDYFMDLVTDIGNVSVNGQNYKKSFHQQSSGGSKSLSLTAEASTGDISLSY